MAETRIAVKDRRALLPAEVEWNILKDKAQIAVQSRMFGNMTPQEVLARMMFGQELGLSPMTSMRAVYVTDSKDGRKSLGLMADAMIALCYAKIPGFRHEIEMLPDGSAQGKFWRDGWTKPYVTQFGDKEAKAAGLLEKPGAMYNKYKANMYRSRVKADGARFAGPEACMGLYTPEEMGARVTITADGEEMVETSPAVDTETGEVEEAKVEVDDGDADFLVVLCDDCQEAIPPVVTAGNRQYTRGDWLKKCQAKFRADLCVKCSMDRAEVLKRETEKSAA